MDIRRRPDGTSVARDARRASSATSLPGAPRLARIGHRTRGTPVPKEYVRLTTPLVRDGDRLTGTLRPATWDEALDRAVDGLRAAGAAHGSRTYGLFSCSKSTNEVNYAAQKFSRTVLGSNNIDSCNRT